MSKQFHYGVWRRQMADALCCPGQWILTSHSLTARTDGAAQAKLRRMFSGAGFSCMSLVAVPCGDNPNKLLGGGYPATEEVGRCVAD